MRPKNLKTKIFCDGGDPEETKKLLDLLGFLDGQTTNPTHISKNPQARARIERGEKFSHKELLDFYRGVVQEISTLIPQGSVSIEVYADKQTLAAEILKQAREMFSWIPNAHIKIPVVYEGFLAAEQAVSEGIRINFTLCFQQHQAAAAYAVTRGANRGDVFVSPFVGRLDDQGENGMDLIKNILQMYQKGDGHIEVLTASVRNLDHFLYALQLGSDIITAPYPILEEWGKRGMPIPGDEEFEYFSKGLASIPYQELDLNTPWNEFDLSHSLTEKGLEKFAADWKSLLRE